jgi:hypothetical protein
LIFTKIGSDVSTKDLQYINFTINNLSVTPQTLTNVPQLYIGGWAENSRRGLIIAGSVFMGLFGIFFLLLIIAVVRICAGLTV